MNMILKADWVSRIVLIIRLFFQTFWEKIFKHHKSLRDLTHSWANWFCPVFTDLDIFFVVPFIVEPVFPEQTKVRVCLMITIAVRAFWTCRYGLSFFVSEYGRFAFLLALQHHPNWQWFLDLWDPLHLTHFNPWILQDMVACPYFQQFLHCGTPEFMLAPLIVVVYFPTLKHRLIRLLTLLLLWMSQISIQMINMSDFRETLITHGFEVRMTLSKIWFCLMICSTLLEERHSWDLSWGK